MVFHPHPNLTINFLIFHQKHLKDFLINKSFKILINSNFLLTSDSSNILWYIKALVQLPVTFYESLKHLKIDLY